MSERGKSKAMIWSPHPDECFANRAGDRSSGIAKGQLNPDSTGYQKNHYQQNKPGYSNYDGFASECESFFASTARHNHTQRMVFVEKNFEKGLAIQELAPSYPQIAQATQKRNQCL